MISHRVQKRLTHEVHEALALRDKRGQSKHKDKQAARKAAQDNHTAYKTITGLYATTSLTTYARQAKADADDHLRGRLPMRLYHLRRSGPILKGTSRIPG